MIHGNPTSLSKQVEHITVGNVHICKPTSVSNELADTGDAASAKQKVLCLAQTSMHCIITCIFCSCEHIRRHLTPCLILIAISRSFPSAAFHVSSKPVLVFPVRQRNVQAVEGPLRSLIESAAELGLLQGKGALVVVAANYSAGHWHASSPTTLQAAPSTFAPSFPV